MQVAVREYLWPAEEGGSNLPVKSMDMNCIGSWVKKCSLVYLNYLPISLVTGDTLFHIHIGTGFQNFPVA